MSRELAGRDRDRDHALHAARLHDQVDAEISSKRWIDGYRVEVWNSVCSMWKPVRSAANQVRSVCMPPKARTFDAAVRRTAPGAAPLLHLHELLVRVGNEVLDHVLLAQPVAALHGVVEVLLEGVMRLGTAAAPPSAATVWLRMGIDLRRSMLSEGSDSAIAIAARSPHRLRRQSRRPLR